MTGNFSLFEFVIAILIPNCLVCQIDRLRMVLPLVDFISLYLSIIFIFG